MILITGGRGFLGSALQRALDKRGLQYRAVGRATADLRHGAEAVALVKETAPETLIHLAAVVGGIGANRRSPGTFWRDNLLMGLHVLEAARQANVPKTIMVGTTCSYPKFAPMGSGASRFPFREEFLFEGFPEETNAPYGIAKRALLVGAWAYRQEFGLDIATAIPTNLYGPGDNFDLQASHVIPAMIRKFHEAKERRESEVTLWGTGKATRDFLYVDDCAEGLCCMISKDAGREPINLGSGIEVSVRALAGMMREIVGYTGAIKWDESMPDGQPRRCLNIARARAILDWSPTTQLEDGLRNTYAWFSKEALL